MRAMWNAREQRGANGGVAGFASLFPLRLPGHNRQVSTQVDVRGLRDKITGGVTGGHTSLCKHM